ncbi:MAG: hypothetical protein QM767_01795 [Anaeromyxobacter sp.]
MFQSLESRLLLAGDAKVNFQPAAVLAVSGYLVDAGAMYAARSGRTYGWNAAQTAVDRNLNSNQLLDTNIAVKAGGKWELALPNGTYTVNVSVGDAGAASTNNVWVEGKQLFNYQPLGANAFASKSISVDVADGKLTVGIGSAAGGATRLNYVEVSSATVPPVVPPIVPPTVPTPNVRPAVTPLADMSVKIAPGKVTLPNGAVVNVAGGSLTFDAPQIVHRDWQTVAPKTIAVVDDGKPYYYLSTNLRPTGMTARPAVCIT